MGAITLAQCALTARPKIDVGSCPLRSRLDPDAGIHWPWCDHRPSAMAYVRLDIVPLATSPNQHRYAVTLSELARVEYLRDSTLGYLTFIVLAIHHLKCQLNVRHTQW